MSDLRFTPLGLDDASFAADVYTAVRPEAPSDPVALRYEWENPSENWISERFVVERDDRRVGIAEQGHPPWAIVERRWSWIGGDLWPRDRGDLELVLSAMEERARAAGATLLRAGADEDDPRRIEALGRLGYHEDRRSRFWELDLVTNRERLAAMAERSREHMRREGIRLLTLAEDSDPERYREIWRVTAEAERDIPTTIPHVQDTLEDILKWLRAPSIREDRFWIAREGEAMVGMSVLDYPPVRGIVSTSWTATSRSARGRGIARALKCETVMQAMALGVDRVWTGNDAQNGPILHLNETMGYRPIPGTIEYLKDL